MDQEWHVIAQENKRRSRPEQRRITDETAQHGTKQRCGNPSSQLVLRTMPTGFGMAGGVMEWVLGGMQRWG